MTELGEHQIATRGSRARDEWLRRLVEPRIGSGVGPHRGGRHLHAADPVNHAVVYLRDDGEAVALQSVDEPRLPQRLPPVELLRHQATGEPLELTLVTGQRQARVPEVVVGIEGGVVHPDRMAEERDHLDPLAIARHAVEGRGHDVVDAFQVDGAARAALEHADRADVHVGAAVLDPEEGRVEGGEPFVVSVPCHLCPLCRNRYAGVHDQVSQAIGARG